MRSLVCRIVLVLLSSNLAWVPTTTPSALAQDPPAETYQPGPWQPIARIDSTRPVQIQIVNRVGALLEYGLTDPDTIEQILPTGQTAQTVIVSLPAFLTINTLERSALKYFLTVQGNQVTVQVERINDVVGDRTLNIADTGAIYIY